MSGVSGIARVGLVLATVAALPFTWALVEGITWMLHGVAEGSLSTLGAGAPNPGRNATRVGHNATRVAEAMTLLSLGLGGVSYWIQRRLARMGVRRVREGRPDLRVWARMSAFLIASSLVQIPGLVAILTAPFGAATKTVGAAVALGTAAVSALGAITLRDAAREAGPAPREVTEARRKAVPARPPQEGSDLPRGVRKNP